MKLTVFDQFKIAEAINKTSGSKSFCSDLLERGSIKGKGEKPMKHRLVKQLKAENKRLRAKMKTTVEKEGDNNCPMCSGISDETLKQLENKTMSKCH